MKFLIEQHILLINENVFRRPFSKRLSILQKTNDTDIPISWHLKAYFISNPQTSFDTGKGISLILSRSQVYNLKRTFQLCINF